MGNNTLIKAISRSLILASLISLSACQASGVDAIESVPFEGRYWVNTHDYYGEGYTFDLLDEEGVENRDVFILNNELEMALLLSIFYDQGIHEMYYAENADIDIMEVYLYTLALSPYEIWWEDYLVDVTENYDIYSARFTYDFDSVHEVNKQVDIWNQDINSTVFTKDEKTEMIYINLLDQVSYDDLAAESIERDSQSFSAIGALKNKKAVCHGYSLAYLAMLKDVDVPAIVISSTIDDHAWNLVYTEGEWSYFDATWEDEQNDPDFYYYYGMDQEETEIDHVFDEKSDQTLSIEDYFDLAYYAFPETVFK